MSQIFIKGNPYDVSKGQIFYFAAKDEEGRFYFLTKQFFEEDKYSNILFISMTGPSIMDIVTAVTVYQSDNQSYYMRGNYSTASVDFLSVNAVNIVDIYPQANKTNFKLLNSEGLNNGLYPGVWYTFFNNDVEVLWKTKTCSTLGPYCDKIDPGTKARKLNIMLIPLNDDSKPIVGWISGSCKTATGYTKLGLEWFTNWSLGNSVNCNSGKISKESNFCYFTDLETCQKGSLYETCPLGEQCGPCLGICNNGNQCLLDYDENNPLACDPKYPKPPSIWEKYKTIIITVCVILAVLLIVIFIIIGVYVSKNKNKKE